MPSDWLVGSLVTYAKYSDLLNILLRALQRSFRRLKILLCVPSDLQNESRMNSSCPPTLIHVSQGQQSKQHIFCLMVVLNYCRKGIRSLIARGASCTPDVFKSHIAALVEPSYARLHLTQSAVTPLIGLVSATDCK